MIRTIRLRDLIKYLVGLIVIILIAIYSTRFFSNFANNNNFSSFNIDFKKILKSNISIANLDEEIKIKSEKYTSRSGITRILDLELPNIADEKTENLEIAETEQIMQIEEIQEEQEKQETKREEVQLEESYTNSYGSVKIKNDTDIKLTESMLTPDYNLKNKKDIIIFHTHTCESYTPTKENTYKASGNFRTTDLNYSVVRVGKELEEQLKKYNFNVIRDKTKHDYPAYSGSYERSLKTVQSLLKKNSSTEIVFDIHRDAIGSSSNFAPTVEINGEKVAQLMFVIGTNDGGGKHPNWKNNLKFAIKIQEKANEMYPGLFRNINLRSATFNQKVTNAASIIEVGATGNTLEEACGSMRYLAEVLAEVLGDVSKTSQK